MSAKSTKMLGSALMTLLLIVAMSFTFSVKAFATETTPTPYTGQTDAGTYEISTAAQLAKLSQVVNDGLTEYSGSTFYLTSDIDLSVSDTFSANDTTLSWTGNTNWTPIGGMCSENSNYVPTGYGFSGVFNGYYNNTVHKIKNMTIDSAITASTKAGYGLFGYLKGGAVGNLVLEGGSVTVTGAAEYVGSLAGYASGNVYNVTSNLTVTASGASNVGGIAGAVESRTSGAISVKYVKNTGSVTGSKRVGGVVGGIYSLSGNIVTLDCAANLGDVSSVGSYKVYAGGIVGYTRGDILHSYNTGSVQANTSTSDGGRYVGGITGILNGYSAPYANLKYSFSCLSGDKTIEGCREVSALYASADTSTRPTIENAFWNSGVDLDQTTSPNWGTIVEPVQGVGTDVFSGASNVDSPYGQSMLYYLNGNSESNTYFEQGSSYPTLVWESTSGFKVDNLTAADAQGGASSTDDTSMLFVDFTTGSDTTGSGTNAAPYKTIEKALENVTSSRNVVYLLSTYPVSTDTTITSTSNVIIKRSCQNSDYLFEVTSGTLTLQNITLDGNRNDGNYTGAFAEPVKSLVNVNGGTLSIAGATLQNSYANSGAAVRIMAGTATMSSGTISNNRAVDNGGAVMVSGTSDDSYGTFTLTGGTISNNEAGTCGDSIYVDGSFNLNPATSTTLSGTVYLCSDRTIACGSSLSLLANTVEVKAANEVAGVEVAQNVTSSSIAAKFAYADDSCTLTYDDRNSNVCIGSVSNSASALEVLESNSLDTQNEALAIIDWTKKNTITSDATISDGTVIGAVQTFSGGTAESPITITIDGEVSAQGKIGYPFLVDDGAYVRFVGTNNATISAVSNMQFIINVNGGTAEIQNIVFDGNNHITQAILNTQSNKTSNLTLINSVVKNCTPTGSTICGGIATNGGTLTLDGVEVSNVTYSLSKTYSSECVNGYKTAMVIKGLTLNGQDSSKYALYNDTGGSTAITPTSNITVGKAYDANSGFAFTPQAGSTISSYKLVKTDGTEVTDIPTAETNLGASFTSLNVEVAQAPAVPTFKASIANAPTTKVAPGEKFTADVILTSDTIPASACLDLTVNSDVAKVIAVTPAESLGANAQGSFATDGSTAKVSFYGNTAEAKDGLKVATVTFEAVKEGSASIALVSTEDSVAGITGNPSAEYKITVPAAATQVTVKYPLLESVSFGGNYCLAKYTPNAALPNTQVVKYGEQTMYLAEDGSWYCTIAKDVTPSLDSITVVEGTPTAYKDLAKGDVNENDRINIVDAQITYDVATAKFSGFDKLSALGVFKADVNNDKALDATDAFAIQVYVHTGSFAVVDQDVCALGAMNFRSKEPKFK